MKPLALLLITFGLFNAALGQQAFYDVSAVAGNGLRLWNSNAYKIHMGHASEYHYGPVTNYSIKMNMNGTFGRGWVWGGAGLTPVAALSNLGHMQIAGNFYVPSGNVGIGTTAPISLLHVNSSSSDVLRIQNPVGGIGNKAGLDFSTYPGSGKVARIEAIDQGAFNGDLAFYTDGDNINNSNVVERLRITSSGNVGIGTTNPVTKLQVDINNLNNDYAQTLPGIYTRNLNATDNNYNGFTIGDASGWGIAGIYAQVKSHTNHTASLSFFTRKNGAAPAPNMTLDEEGRLGIGTTTPDSKLSVKGNIHAQEVKVDLNGAVAPDYVFEKDYALTSLEELETYIDKNKHLPEVPSAKEMEESGINLKEMNLLLLRKIEEVTLHLIEQNNQMTLLREEGRVSADLSAKKVEELTLHIIGQEQRIKTLENDKR